MPQLFPTDDADDPKGLLDGINPAYNSEILHKVYNFPDKHIFGKIKFCFNTK